LAIIASAIMSCMAASFSTMHAFGLPFGSIVELIEPALRDIGATHVRWSSDRSQVMADLRISFWSWGETLVVNVRSDGTVFIRSECIFPLQIIDWGKNRQNCHTLLTAIQLRLSQFAACGPAPPPLPQHVPPYAP
jgi:hypothetical protein